MNEVIRLGTRQSELALWQANMVAQLLGQLGLQVKTVPVKSEGDLALNQPIYKMGFTGVFTRALDLALLNNEIDIAVHSFKDVPTVLPEKVRQIAVIKREAVSDVLVLKSENTAFEATGAVATGSLRRKAQWLNRYPEAQLTGIRGNVNSRLEKLRTNDWMGVIFARAGLERLNMLPKHIVELNWMIPAPAQGAIVVTGLEKNGFTQQWGDKINHKPTQICTTIERAFLNELEGGCTAPIGAIAFLEKKKINFKAGIFSLDGEEKMVLRETFEVPDDAAACGREWARKMRLWGGDKILENIKNQLLKIDA